MMVALIVILAATAQTPSISKDASDIEEFNQLERGDQDEGQ